MNDTTDETVPSSRPHKARASTVMLVPTFMYKLTEGDVLVRRDFGTVHIDRITKCGGRRMELSFTDDEGRPRTYLTWLSTHARRHPRPGENGFDERPGLSRRLR
jgi:hypothetical protein